MNPDSISWRWGCEIYLLFIFFCQLRGTANLHYPNSVFINLPLGAFALALVLPCLWYIKLYDDLGDSKSITSTERSVFWRFDFIGL